MISRIFMGSVIMKHTTVVFAFGRSIVSAELSTNGRRVLDALREPKSDYLRFRNAKIFSQDDLDAPAKSYSQLHVKSSDVNFFILSQEDERDPHARFNRMSTTKYTKGGLLVNSFTIFGRIHGIDRFSDASGTFFCQLSDFVPVTEAKVHGVNIPNIDAKTVIVNRRAVTAYIECDD